jgi:hypothetical protein
MTDRDILEVQKRAMRMVTGLKGTEFDARLKEPGLETLEERRHQADMHMMHKIMHGNCGLDRGQWFETAEAGEQTMQNMADPLNTGLNNGRLELRRNFFSVRVGNDSNKIPGEMKILSEQDFKVAYRKYKEGQMHPAS